MKYLFLTTALVLPAFVWAEDVTVANLVRAETDNMIRANMQAMEMDFGMVAHMRAPTNVDDQPVIRMNQDTLYGGAVLDLSEPVSITLPEVDGRYMSMLVISQDHYLLSEATPGTYELTEELVGSPFAVVAFRTFVDVTDPEDVAAAHLAQDAISMTGGGPGPFVAPDWDLDQLAIARKAVSDLASLGFDASNAFGTKDEVDSVDHLIGAIAGWGGLPAKAATYQIDAVEDNDGDTSFAVTLNDVPVRAFWSVTVYNAEGYMEANDLGVNSYNNYTATPAGDGSTTIHFGGCDDGRANCLPITPGWNYAVRLYEPEQEILDGSWTFPPFVVAN